MIDWGPSACFAPRLVAAGDAWSRPCCSQTPWTTATARSLGDPASRGPLAAHDGNDVRGVPVHIAARVMAQDDAGEVLVSWATSELPHGSSIPLEPAGVHEPRGLDEPKPLLRPAPA